MGKFAIECPKCESINTATTGLFSKRVIKCGTCGHDIDTKVGRYTAKVCPNCDKKFVFDQAHPKDRRCPNCNHRVDVSQAATASYNYTEISCPQCNCNIDVNRNTEFDECPICGLQIDVATELKKVELRDKITEIRYKGDNQTLVWKHPIEDFVYGSLLEVQPSQEAIVIVSGYRNGPFGPGLHKLETGNMKGHADGHLEVPRHGTPFHGEVYFFNKAYQMNIPWGTAGRVHYKDMETGLNLTLGASGTFAVQVSQPSKLLERLVGTTSGLTREAWEDTYEATVERNEVLMDLFVEDIQSVVKTYLAQAIKELKISIFEIESYMTDIAEKIKPHLSEVFEEFGLIVPKFMISNFALPEDDKAFRDFQQRFAEDRLQAQKAQQLREGGARQVMEAEEEAADYLAKKRREREAEEILLKQDLERRAGLYDAEVQRAHGFTQKDVIDAEVQKAYAASMGQMGANIGAGGGGGGGGGGPVNDMIGMVMGVKMAENMMGRLDGVMNQSNPNAQSAPTQNADAWTCTCGQTNTGKFCPHCGASKPETWDCACGQKANSGKFCMSCGAAKPEAWDCTCGQKGNTGKFCMGCGKPKAVKAEGWDCACGEKGITSKFCPNCGQPKPAAPATWDCACGAKGITSKFCPNCGQPKTTTWNCECGKTNNTGKCCPECGARCPE